MSLEAIEAAFQEGNRLLRLQHAHVTDQFEAQNRDLASAVRRLMLEHGLGCGCGWCEEARALLERVG